MSNLAWIYLELILTSGAAFFAAYAFQRWKSRFHRVIPPRPGTVFRISNGLNMLGTRLSSIVDEHWRFDPPLSGSGEAVMENGRSIMGEYTASMGLVRFRTKIVEVEESGHFLVNAPVNSQIVDRRTETRIRRSGEVAIESQKSIWIDLSAQGGRFETEYAARKGERIRLDFPELSNPIFGWVLEIYPKQIRVRFEEKMPYLK